MGAAQDPFGEIHPLVQLGDFLPESIHLGQQLGILRGRNPPPEPIGKAPCRPD